MATEKWVKGREQPFLFYKGLGGWFSKWGPWTSISIIWESAIITNSQVRPDPLHPTVWERGQVIRLNGGGGLGITEPTLQMRKTEAQKSKFTLTKVV